MERKYNPKSEYTATEQDKRIVDETISSLEWYDCPPHESLPFSQGYALQEMVKQWGHKTDRIGHGVLCNGRALLAIRDNYTAGHIRRVTTYAVDDGLTLRIVAVDEETADDIRRAKAVRIREHYTNILHRRILTADLPPYLETWTQRIGKIHLLITKP